MAIGKRKVHSVKNQNISSDDSLETLMSSFEFTKSYDALMVLLGPNLTAICSILISRNIHINKMSEDDLKINLYHDGEDIREKVINGPYFYCTQRDIMDRTTLSKKTVQRLIKDLVKMGILSRINKGKLYQKWFYKFNQDVLKEYLEKGRNTLLSMKGEFECQ